MTDLRGAVRDATARLREAGIPSPGVDAVALAAHVLAIEPADVRRLMIVGGALPATFEQAYAAVLAERARRVPLQHLTGRAHFRTLTLHVGPGVFVPRPETEVLVDLALTEIDGVPGTEPSGIRLVDLCSGSGAIALAIKQERPHVWVRSLELSTLAKYAFGLAQAFNAFYHRQPILKEEREAARLWRAAGVIYVRRQLTRALDLMGCDVPPRM